MSPSDITNEFDCHIPCEFHEYVLVEDLLTSDDFFHSTFLKAFTFVLSSREMLVKREVQLYEVTSLVGDTGGSFGLFLGFSFFTLWEWTVVITGMVLSKIGK